MIRTGSRSRARFAPRAATGKTVLATLAFATLALMMSGCLSQNPYPAQGTVSADKNTPTAQPVFFIKAPQSVDFQEGQAGSFTLTPRVPEGDQAIISAMNLPQGAQFDPSTYKFTWTPDHNAGHDPNNPTVFEKHYHVQFQLRDSADPLTVGYTCEVELIVQGAPRPLDLKADQGSYQIQEDQQLTANFKVTSKDFPKGPFSLQISPLPDGAVVTPSDTDPTAFTLTFSPAYDFVNVGNSDGSDSKGLYKTLQLTATATGPRAQKVQKTITLTVRDVRQAPEVSVGDNLIFSYAADFSLFAEDLNGEVAPTVNYEQPPYGSVDIEYPSSEPAREMRARGPRKNPVQVAAIRWSGIPANQLNKPQQLTLDVCVNDSQGNNDNCVKRVVHMTFVGQLHAAPQFDRTDWSRGAVKYLRLDSTQDHAYSIPVTVPDDGNDTPTVTVEPASAQNEVSYADGQLTIAPQSTGIKVFDLVAISSYGIKTRESFTYRVLPKNWGSMILLGQSPQDPEVQATLQLLTDTQLLNPAIDSIDSDELVRRSALFFTTGAIESVLSSSALGSLLDTVSTALPSVIISSPLIGKFPRPSLPPDVTLVARYNTIPHAPALVSMSLVPAKGSVFMPSQKPVKLNQSLTQESGNPMVFAVNPKGQCSVLLSLTDGNKNSYPAAVDCVLSNGNHLMLAGFEWGDVALDPEDAGLTQAWLQSWLSSSGSSNLGPKRQQGRLQ